MDHPLTHPGEQLPTQAGIHPGRTHVPIPCTRLTDAHTHVHTHARVQLPTRAGCTPTYAAVSPRDAESAAPGLVGAGSGVAGAVEAPVDPGTPDPTSEGARRSSDVSKNEAREGMWGWASRPRSTAVRCRSLRSRPDPGATSDMWICGGDGY
jgi:hypothetical protein